MNSIRLERQNDQLKGGEKHKSENKSAEILRFFKYNSTPTAKSEKNPKICDFYFHIGA